MAQQRRALRQLEQRVQTAENRSAERSRWHAVQACLEDFRAQIDSALEDADASLRRDIIQSLVKQIELDDNHVKITYRISPTKTTSANAPSSPASPKIPPYCGRLSNIRLRRKRTINGPIAGCH